MAVAVFADVIIMLDRFPFDPSSLAIMSLPFAFLLNDCNLISLLSLFESSARFEPLGFRCGWPFGWRTHLLLKRKT